MTTPASAPQVDEATAARSEIYGLFADALDFPTRDFHMQIEAGVLRDDVTALVAALPYAVDVADAMPGLALVDDYISFQGEYIRIFDVGAVRPPCPLYDGEWGGARKRAMEEVLRFYRFFGMKMGDGTHDLPDHVSIELEFMRVLAITEGIARGNGGDVAPLLRAERDFVERHPGRWWPLLQRKLPAQDPPPFYASLATVVGGMLAADLAYLKNAIASTPGAA